jgi:hypothetical protein
VIAPRIMLNMRATAGWLGGNGLNLLALFSLRVASPLRAVEWVRYGASLLPPLNTIDDAQRAAKAMGTRGTCLSRSIAVAVRCDSADLVVGVGRGKGERGTGQHRMTLGAHAWVEIGGESVGDEAERMWTEITRLKMRRSR